MVHLHLFCYLGYFWWLAFMSFIYEYVLCWFTFPYNPLSHPYITCSSATMNGALSCILYPTASCTRTFTITVQCPHLTPWFAIVYSVTVAPHTHDEWHIWDIMLFSLFIISFRFLGWQSFRVVLHCKVSTDTVFLSWPKSCVSWQRDALTTGVVLSHDTIGNSDIFLYISEILFIPKE